MINTQPNWFQVRRCRWQVASGDSLESELGSPRGLSHEPQPVSPVDQGDENASEVGTSDHPAELVTMPGPRHQEPMNGANGKITKPVNGGKSIAPRRLIRVANNQVKMKYENELRVLKMLDLTSKRNNVRYARDYFQHWESFDQKLRENNDSIFALLDRALSNGDETFQQLRNQKAFKSLVENIDHGRKSLTAEKLLMTLLLCYMVTNNKIGFDEATKIYVSDKAFSNPKGDAKRVSEILAVSDGRSSSLASAIEKGIDNAALIKMLCVDAQKWKASVKSGTISAYRFNAQNLAKVLGRQVPFRSLCDFFLEAMNAEIPMKELLTWTKGNSFWSNLNADLKKRVARLVSRVQPLYQTFLWSFKADPPGRQGNGNSALWVDTSGNLESEGQELIGQFSQGEGADRQGQADGNLTSPRQPDNVSSSNLQSHTSPMTRKRKTNPLDADFHRKISQVVRQDILGDSLMEGPHKRLRTTEHSSLAKPGLPARSTTVLGQNSPSAFFPAEQPGRLTDQRNDDELEFDADQHSFDFLLTPDTLNWQDQTGYRLFVDQTQMSAMSNREQPRLEQDDFVDFGENFNQ